MPLAHIQGRRAKYNINQGVEKFKIIRKILLSIPAAQHAAKAIKMQNAQESLS